MTPRHLCLAAFSMSEQHGVALLNWFEDDKKRNVRYDEWQRKVESAHEIICCLLIRCRCCRSQQSLFSVHFFFFFPPIYTLIKLPTLLKYCSSRMNLTDLVIPLKWVWGSHCYVLNYTGKFKTFTVYCMCSFISMTVFCLPESDLEETQGKYIFYMIHLKTKTKKRENNFK